METYEQFETAKEEEEEEKKPKNTIWSRKPYH